jgi:phospholipid/cholesterol/gamma-HCH transport system ATP-binding protein
VIRVEGVSKSFGGVPVLTDVSFEVPTGGTLALVGPGGAGKSLLLKLICGLLRPDSGRIFVDDDEVTALGEAALMRVRGRIGMVFQNYALFDYMNVGQNVGFPLAQAGGVAEDEIRRRVATRLAEVNLEGIEHLMPRELSGGMKKRVCLARATIHDPPIMLCDDPTAGLDPVTTTRIFRLLKRLQAENGATAIIVSHEVDYLRPLCDRFVMLSRGEMLFRGAYDDALAAAPAEARQFLTGENVA